ncbi:MAG: Crp/Fnr family transcriptional regulator [Alphaproteobacteria bacterium BRH_c36]|nr:MAG: Crp/Fnr family transcriptional regulator [Alphaproteobacteria bacterium BRH_c36]
MSRGPIDFDKLHRDGVPFASFQAGEKVFLADEAGDAMYVVRSGLVDILMFGRVLETVGPGGIFGEMSLIDENPRSAAALVASNAEVAILSRAEFLAQIMVDPKFALYVLQVMAQRLRRLDDAIAAKGGDEP